MIDRSLLASVRSLLASTTLALIAVATPLAHAQLAVIALENKVVLDNGATKTVVKPRSATRYFPLRRWPRVSRPMPIRPPMC